MIFKYSIKTWLATRFTILISYCTKYNDLFNAVLEMSVALYSSFEWQKYIPFSLTETLLLEKLSSRWSFRSFSNHVRFMHLGSGVLRAFHSFLFSLSVYPMWPLMLSMPSYHLYLCALCFFLFLLFFLVLLPSPHFCKRAFLVVSTPFFLRVYAY